MSSFTDPAGQVALCLALLAFNLYGNADVTLDCYILSVARISRHIPIKTPDFSLWGGSSCAHIPIIQHPYQGLSRYGNRIN